MDILSSATHKDLRTASFERMLATNRNSYLAFLLKRLGNRTDAEDVLHDFVVRVLAHRDQLRDSERMDAWLYSVLRSTLNDHYRRMGRSTRLNNAVAMEMQSAENVQAPAEHGGTFCKCAKDLVPQLRSADAELIERIDIDDGDRAAIARELGIQPGTLNVRLHRARSALSGILLAHCGPCCRDGFDDCYCAPRGCEQSTAGRCCSDTKSTDSKAR